MVCGEANGQIHVTPKGQGQQTWSPICRKQLEMLFGNSRYLLDSLLWSSTVGYPGDSLASCYIFVPSDLWPL